MESRNRFAALSEDVQEPPDTSTRLRKGKRKASEGENVSVCSTQQEPKTNCDWSSMSRSQQKKWKKRAKCGKDVPMEAYAEVFGSSCHPAFRLKNIKKNIRPIGKLSQVQCLFLSVDDLMVAPAWSRLDHRLLVSRIVLVVVDGIGQSLFEAHRDAFPQVQSFFGESFISVQGDGFADSVSDPFPILLSILPRNVKYFTEKSRHAVHMIENSAQVEEEERSDNVQTLVERLEPFTLTIPMLRMNNYVLEPSDLEISWIETRKDCTNGEIRPMAVALDCEMCEDDEHRDQVARVSLVDFTTEKILYDEFVIPEREVIDYRTQWSGITEENLGRATKSFVDVQQDFLRIVSTDCIVVGHSLENDFRCLQIIHRRVVDTSVLFPHHFDPSLKQSLRFLAKKHLSRDIQGSSAGHSSIEDAVACIELVKMRLKSDPSGAGTVSELLRNLECSSSFVVPSDDVLLVGGGGKEAEDDSCVSVVCASTDAEATERFSDAVGSSRYSVVHLVNPSSVLQSLEAGDGTVDSVSSGVVDACKELDSQCGSIIGSCPDNSLVLLFCGGYTGLVKKMRESRREMGGAVSEQLELKIMDESRKAKEDLLFVGVKASKQQSKMTPLADKSAS